VGAAVSVDGCSARCVARPKSKGRTVSPMKQWSHRDRASRLRKDNDKIPYSVPVHRRLTLGNLLSLLLFATVVFCCAFYVFVALATANWVWPFQS
jgi:hypothetical protein